MRRIRDLMLLAGIALALSVAPVIEGQGKGGGKGQGGGGEPKGRSGGQGQAKGPSQGKGQGKGKGSIQGRGNENQASRGRGNEGQVGQGRGRPDDNLAATARTRGNGKVKFTRFNSPSSMPQSLRRYATSRRPQDVIVAAAVAHAFARGRGNDLRIDQFDDGMRVRNRKGDRLIFLRDESARDLGRWRVGVIGDEVRGGSPAFCRSGEGHPVWGRQWCLNKDFGLGASDDFRWGRTDQVGDLVFTPGLMGGRLIGDALAGVLGNTAFNRLALHAVTLGLVEPLVGRWVTDVNGPQMLMVDSGALPVAEFVDVNRDNRADNMLVALRTW